LLILILLSSLSSSSSSSSSLQPWVRVGLLIFNINNDY
jgi:hypothetical protein